MSVLGKAPIALALGLAACATGAELDGTIGGMDFSVVQTALHGGGTILFADDLLQCPLDIGWVDDHYYDGVPPTENHEFVALQFEFDASLQPGTYTIANDAPFVAEGLVLQGDTFEVDHAREGSITIEDITEKRLEGTLSVSFGEDAVAGRFVTEYCVAFAL